MNDSVSYRFVADVHLGRLAKWLRLLGFDVRYSNDASPATLAATALAENSILLSKWVGFSQNVSLQFLQIKSSNSTEQLQQVLTHFQLKTQLQPFIRCLICNGHLQPIPKAEIEALLQPDTQKSFQRFWQCNSCQHLYWEGSHYERMQRLVEQVSKY